MSTIDYRKLLVKYMKHVDDEEGSPSVPYGGDGFTEEEVAELERIHKETYARPGESKEEPEDDASERCRFCGVESTPSSPATWLTRTAGPSGPLLCTRCLS